MLIILQVTQIGDGGCLQGEGVRDLGDLDEFLGVVGEYR